MSEPANEADGRRLRRQLNRAAVLDALVELFEQGSYTPASAEVAERAGISPRSLFRYFDDIDDLNRAAIERQLAVHRHLLEPDLDGAASTAERIERFVSSRVRLHEAVRPGARAARLCAHRSPVVAAQLQETRRWMREQVRRVFAEELAGGCSAMLPAIDELCSFESSELMRFGHQMSRAATTSALVAALGKLLDNESEKR